MRKPNVGKPRSASAMFTLSRRLPKLSLPASVPPSPSARAHPRVGKPATAEHAQGGPLPAMSSAPPPRPLPLSAPLPVTPQLSAPASTAPAPAHLPPTAAAGSHLPVTAMSDDACTRCGHDETLHPVRYVCDRYPHPDPLQICGCESESLEEKCSSCGHRARAHKPRHRCRETACHCWGYEQVP